MELQQRKNEHHEAWDQILLQKDTDKKFPEQEFFVQPPKFHKSIKINFKLTGIFFGAVIFLAVVTVGGVMMSRHVRDIAVPESADIQQQKTPITKNVPKEETPYADDTKGGKTPEETIQLYVAALEKKDIEEAVTYVVISDQEQERSDLRSLLEDVKKYNTAVKNIRTAKKISQDESLAQFEYKITKAEETTVKGTNIVIPPGTYEVSFSLRKIPSGVWKMEN